MWRSHAYHAAPSLRQLPHSSASAASRLCASMGQMAWVDVPTVGLIFAFTRTAVCMWLNAQRCARYVCRLESLLRSEVNLGYVTHAS
mmetsp:Transcript_2193/g.6910  ORF Transcript_2193/g.6910 Transcript_2193/m.6910 type:complete len:87 (+) Transcript_2193:282-542(+)